MMSPATTATLLAIVVVMLCLVHVIDGGVVDREPRAYKQYNSEPPAKRPFCNAFTGCGKKRSVVAVTPMALMHRHQTTSEQNRAKVTEGFDPNEDSLANLIDLNTEPAVEDLMRQIMSEAKLWEAIQEANREIYLQKQGQSSDGNPFPMSFSTQ
ncbi:cardioactive peptide [Topomyia yanbarensis]|uniref:cardioactive peptide n=1 Tax=Topomyia yanbarensis TaxID=2498891 RepID=UPI00273BD7D9|nr:cardioactive peptide [Topomyia yanbarensis]XP_058823975.1 cardioactive peptide [Topomyia yanbarensis]XP_058823976.1 cardioactive peptide [Topomyia yanbarensis]XP_058823977.1 cardioactive peptide [Topomyia yanbarensis]XP_058823978.1 cardioactive peptide [Topomyia yanbarensis]XP_058823979.1 cardioactive peptide [Topomyia yanbarensis]